LISAPSAKDYVENITTPNGTEQRNETGTLVEITNSVKSVWKFRASDLLISLAPSNVRHFFIVLGKVKSKMI
jgi:hypothetical protein